VDSATRLIAIYFSHFCALVIVLTLLGAIRLVRSVRPLYGPARLSQILALSWLVLLVVATYMVPPVGIWAIGFVVPLFADSHFHAWMSEQLGAEALVRTRWRFCVRWAPRSTSPWRASRTFSLRALASHWWWWAEGATRGNEHSVLAC
jgi:hypothetical protein